MKQTFELSEKESDQEFQRVSKDLLEHNALQGVNYWAGSPYPTMLLWAGRVYDFLHILEEIVGYPLARRHSYLVGHRSGWDGAEVNGSLLGTLPQSERPRKILMDGSRILAGAGWGRSSIEYDPDAKSVVWEFPNGTAIGLAAKLESARSNPACAFISGFVAGWTNRSLTIESEFEETECVARGDPRCRFTATKFGRLPA